jgi:intein/homing endonuclease
MGGTSPGGAPLQNSLDHIERLLNRCIERGQTRLRPIDAMDIICHASDSVLAGGIRRSALITIFSADDVEMVNAKTGNWFIENGQRGRSNNSALLLRTTTSKEEFVKIMESVKNFGEPGFIWSDSTEVVFNPCVPADTWITTDEGSKQVKDLIAKKFNALVDGKKYRSAGFFRTGTKHVFKLSTKEGFEVRATDNHKIRRDDLDWVELKDLVPGERILIHDHSSRELNINLSSTDFARGWLVGALYYGAYFNGATHLCFWGDARHEMWVIANQYLKKLEINDLVQYSYKDYMGDRIMIHSDDLSLRAAQYFGEPIRKPLQPTIEAESLNFRSGFLRALFDGRGEVIESKEDDEIKNGDEAKEGAGEVRAPHGNARGSRAPSGNAGEARAPHVILHSKSLVDLRIVQRLALSFGVYGVIKADRGDNAKAIINADEWQLSISDSSLDVYNQHIGFYGIAKLNALVRALASRTSRPETNYTAEIIGIEADETCAVYDATVEYVHGFDANGIHVHNCAEISLYPVDEQTGETGTQMCNLTEINAGAVKSEQDFYDACRASAILGTFQAAYTKFEYLGEVSERVVAREALLGCSMTGIMENPNICMNPDILRKGATIIKAENRLIAAKLGINPAARTTAVKPAGSTSCLLGSSSGIHPAHSRRYFRRVQVNKLEEPQAFFAKYNPDAIENSVWSANKSDNVITFLCETPAEAIVNADLDAVDFLKCVKTVQENWVNSGRDESLCVKPWLQHNVSNTVTVGPSEWESVADFIYENRNVFTGVSILPASGDKTYKQAPFESILTSKEIIEEFGDGAIFSSGVIIHALQAFNNDLFDACDAVMGFGAPLEADAPHDSQIDALRAVTEKILFVKRAKKFAHRYFNDDIQRMCYCLKSINSWKRWCDLNRSYVDVPWELFHEAKDNVVVEETIACAGGACELVRM